MILWRATRRIEKSQKVRKEKYQETGVVQSVNCYRQIQGKHLICCNEASLGDTSKGSFTEEQLGF